jgi:hypothetical protein
MFYKMLSINKKERFARREINKIIEQHVLDTNAGKQLS